MPQWPQPPSGLNRLEKLLFVLIVYVIQLSCTTIEWGPGPRRMKGPAEERVSSEHSTLYMEYLGDFNEWTPVSAG